MMARAFLSCSWMRVGAVTSAMPQIGERVPPPQAVSSSTAAARAEGRKVMGRSRSCLGAGNLISPRDREGDRADRREGARDEVVDVVQRVAHQQVRGKRPVPPGGAQV